MPQHRTYVERVCARCNAPYRCRSDSPQYSCSPRCAAFLRHAVRAGRATQPRRAYEERVCVQCGTPFTCRSDTKQKTCGIVCGGLVRRRLAGHNEATCQRCGVTIYAPPSGVALGKGRYCSRACRFGPQEERFWQRVVCGLTPDRCWTWTGTVISTFLPYGRIRWDGRLRLAHHVSYLIHKGEIPDGLIVRHRCPEGGSPGCTNPRHLLLGTMQENAQDTLTDGRHWSQTGRWHPKRIERPDGIPQGHKLLPVFLSSREYRTLQARADALGLDLRVYASEILKGAI